MWVRYRKIESWGILAEDEDTYCLRFILGKGDGEYVRVVKGKEVVWGWRQKRPLDTLRGEEGKELGIIGLRRRTGAHRLLF